MPKGIKIVRDLQDKFWIKQAKSGQEEAYGRLYDRYFNDIYKFIYFKVSGRETAEDLAAEVFFRVWRYLKQNKNIDNVRALLYKTARNLIIDYYRKDKPTSLEEVDEQQLVISKASLVESVSRRDDHERLQAVILELKDEFREVIVLKYIQDLSHQEIAKILNKEVGAVRVLLHRAIKQLRSIFPG
ncbi:MAG: hypothetical protein A2445_02890 [Candidatus Jacksonbacteria bacterium RIFOXYC2_FULL_44_29]|nr:MAG: hypothetical protein A2295_02410 [Candidatus Jacksonbacteria bacterium RIFOXYB2_FULL_44_15]OGY76851.1 MAG: hypothetical protein A2240_04745 [Candidatus Jacksonbacteria bacterium RIFOXYA2_FULL_43_12]OGY80100.1 MAG: hypothetical protein A2445_02890 [Candidatus Jacksonbacteria bacterium RIFOXYC2_FULL_44_29]OGY82210.1 MAG: hypothetical protein A2550_05915 [Candidatus Jacksonbacteria bacterium RIFOXYD2_FULL_43_21]HBH45804.1 hypothetical protein [Candidatus Jacksonbacteria bacterium]